jgi:predicted nucleic acid-binding protein
MPARQFGHADAQIAAITRVHGAKLATRNVRDFADCGMLDVIDPWSVE